MIAAGLSVLLLAVALTAGTAAAGRGGEVMEGRTIEEVLKAHTGQLMSLPGVVGTAQGLCSGRPCIKVYIVKKSAELGRNIPDTIEGYPVMVEESGEFKALPERR